MLPVVLKLCSRRSLISATGALALTGLGAASCLRGEAPLDEEGRIRLRFAIEGKPTAAHGGFYQALANGAYRRRGLTVQIIICPPGVRTPQLLASNMAELGWGSSSFVPMNLIAEGAPVRAVAAFFQKDPQILMSHPDPALTGISSLTGRPFVIADPSAVGAWTWLKHKYGFRDSQLLDAPGTPAMFYDNRRAVAEGSLITDPWRVRQEGRFDPRIFLLADEDYASYGGLVLAPVGFARDNATALRSFIAATAEGWRDYIRGDQAAVSAAESLIRRDNPELPAGYLSEARQAMRLRGIVDGGDAALYGFGAMTADRWQAFFNAAADAGIYRPELNWRLAYTNQYLPGRR